jgi:hypothetical protein
VSEFLPELKRKQLEESLSNLKREEGFGRRIPDEHWTHAMRVFRGKGYYKKDFDFSYVPIGASVARSGVDKTAIENVYIITGESDNTLKRWIDDQGLWERVTFIEDGGEKDVYDLTMDKNSNFVCNGIVVHNCEEGLDIPALDVLVLSLPMGDVEQVVGRVRRWCTPELEKCERLCSWRVGECKEKPIPIVMDVVDEIGKLMPKWKRRKRFYRSIGTLDKGNGLER